MMKVKDVDEQRILWAKGEKCVKDDLCGKKIDVDVQDTKEEGEMVCFAITGLPGTKILSLMAFVTAFIYSM